MKRTALYLIITTIAISLFGFFMIYDASSYISYRDFGDKYHYVKDQFFWMILGFGALGFFSFFNYKKLYTLAVPLLLSAIFFLIVVFIPGLGVSVLGAHRWINLRFSVFQPAEYVKLVLAIYLAAWFSNKEKGRFTAFLFLIGLVLLLIMLEPDMGTAIIILSQGLIIFFISGGNILYLASIVPFILVGGVGLAIVEPYRAKRVAAFLNPLSDNSSSSYHVKQILIALGSGGLTGVGIGNSLQKYAYLPENTTDSIFAIIAEELGFIGSLILILVFIFLIFQIIKIAISTHDNFGRLLASGICAFLSMQILINLAAQTALLPLTGIPLPFISYGGSSLVVDLASIGILLNIAKQNKG